MEEERIKKWRAKDKKMKEQRIKSGGVKDKKAEEQCSTLLKMVDLPLPIAPELPVSER